MNRATNLAPARLCLSAHPADRADAVVRVLAAHLDAHHRNRHGGLDYRPEDLGLDLDDLGLRLTFYADSFLV
ncbi:hypothetical protein [Nocardioides sp. URHA0020]|uniref:hypothetical protein n=1 Tax=Nocardioides sp. URHA0020 TaxID=1380392 RepID=UPI00048BCE16|nr:hypothetical protein [Nocardioides sp. URHA0020]